MEHLHPTYQIVEGIIPSSGNAARAGDWVNLRNAIDCYCVSNFSRAVAAACKIEVERSSDYAGGTKSTMTEGRTVWATTLPYATALQVKTSSSASYTLPSATGPGIVITRIDPSVLDSSRPFVRIYHGNMSQATNYSACIYYIRTRYAQDRPIIATTSST